MLLSRGVRPLDPPIIACVIVWFWLARGLLSRLFDVFLLPENCIWKLFLIVLGAFTCCMENGY